MARGRRRPKVRPWKLWFVGLLPALGGVAALWAAVPHLDVATAGIRSFMPIEYVRVEGAIWNLDAEEFRKAVMPQVRGGYFMVDLGTLEAVAGTFAWVERVEATRVWPDTLVLRIVEQQPVARWGEDSLLNGRGLSFTPPDAAAFVRLPLLSGPPGQEKRVLDMLQSLNEKLQPHHLRVEVLRLSKRLAWEAQLESGMQIVFGNQDPLSAMDRLLALLPQLGEEKIAAIRRLDLRYPNGFSVVWKPEAPIPPESLGMNRERLSPDSASASTDSTGTQFT